MQVHIRWMIKRDLKQVLAIEDASFSKAAWTENDFLLCLRCNNCIGMVCTYDDKVCAYMIYELHPTHLSVLSFAVDPACRHQRVGTQMVAKLVGKLSSHRRTAITLDVREGNLAAQLFFRAAGFRATQVARNFYGDEDGHREDAYRMEYRLPVVAESLAVAEVPQ